MGWASGASLLDDVAKLVMPLLAPTVRRQVAERLIDLFEDADCDTIDECSQPDIARAQRARVDAEG